MAGHGAATGAEPVMFAPGGDRGGAGEFERLFHAHWARVYAVIFRLTGNREEAEETALDVFMRLHRNPPSVGEEGALEGWLYRVATHAGLNAMRSRKRRARHEDAAARELVLETDGGRGRGHESVHEIERVEECARVRRILEGMPERTASILILRHSGLSYRQIATALELSPGSVGTLLVRAEREFERRYRAAGETS